MHKFKNNVSKANGTEIISLLWFILATQISYTPLQVMAIIMGVENLLESWIFAMYFNRRTPKKPKKESI